VAEAEEFTLDAPVPHRGFCLASRWTSARISSGIGGRPAGVRIGPFALDQAPVPGEQGARCHHPVQPKASGQQLHQRGDHGAVGPVRLRAGDLTAQDRNLVPQHQDLRLFRGVAAREERQPAEQPDYEQVDEAKEHERRG
jgi:hypothetical protein